MPQPRSAPKVRKGREGSRWYNERPTAADFAEWFKTVPLHDGLNHEDYVGGVVLIQQKEKTKEVREFNAAGNPMIVDVENLVYSPHPNVSTRVRYFQDYLQHNPELTGVFEIDKPIGGAELGLPAGFFRYIAADPTGKQASFIGYSVRVRLFEADTVRNVDIREGPVGQFVQHRQVEGKVVFDGVPGTKIVPVTGRWGADENALMKAQSGAAGRALGLAGMLVIPGSGIATSEDMHEALSGENQAVATPTLPEPAAGPQAVQQDPVEHMQALRDDLRALDESAVASFEEWARGRGLSTDRPGDVTTAIKRLERDIDRLTRAEPT